MSFPRRRESSGVVGKWIPARRGCVTIKKTQHFTVSLRAQAKQSPREKEIATSPVASREDIVTQSEEAGMTFHI